MRKHTVKRILLILSLLLLTGCSRMGNGITQIEPPMNTNSEQDAIIQALSLILPSGAQYVTAEKTTQKQSILLEDLDGNGQKEAIVLYRDTNENQQIHVLLLQETEDNWNKINDIGTGLLSLDSFIVEDLEGNKKKEVIVGGAISDTEGEKLLSIYEFDGSDLKNTVSRSYKGISIADYKEDSILDIMLVDGGFGKQQTVGLFQYKAGQLQQVASLDLNTDGIVENIVSGKLADGTNGLFIDSGLGAHSMLTEIVIYEDSALRKVGEDSDGVLLKAYPLYSRDINQDGIVEVGGMYIPKGYEDAAMAEIPFLYTYHQYNRDGSNKTVEERYEDSGRQFFITIPQEWNGNVTVKKMESGVNLVAEKDEEVLFEVKWRNKDATSSTGIILGETKDTIYYTDRYDTNSITNDNFHLMEEEYN